MKLVIVGGVAGGAIGGLLPGRDEGLPGHADFAATWHRGTKPVRRIHKLDPGLTYFLSNFSFFRENGTLRPLPGLER